MSEQLPACPKCQSEYTYQDAEMFICPECAHEWAEGENQLEDEQVNIQDAHGNILNDGDSVTVIKDLKIKGSSQVVKVGTKVKTIRLLADASDGHNIDCKIDGIGAIKLKSEYVKKA
ncbi:alkylphosphonate utilization protein [Acinetobacter qingfengensis]|uniref:Alkylphosphonate utilization protein n=1 Tax=Acinetobacter qingfengensis TaxID=1262585 RepID=A0A1E7RFU6_9GAMM|nr:zinc ribbon domain-containing protein YjdM [Acinetobacter qingfengensis]KAA8731851.1 alkylphosphonate utilization protein [Acinetobacter qingfengensis]OEY98025.1 alkylphosphonate utilization protein [Acinetobacter qingfengensis]